MVLLCKVPDREPFRQRGFDIISSAHITMKVDERIFPMAVDTKKQQHDSTKNTCLLTHVNKIKL